MWYTDAEDVEGDGIFRRDRSLFRSGRLRGVDGPDTYLPAKNTRFEPFADNGGLRYQFSGNDMKADAHEEK